MAKWRCRVALLIPMAVASSLIDEAGAAFNWQIALLMICSRLIATIHPYLV
ncbi:hypothetical protein Ssi02_25950 [Sinosporangium siamense]|uniref:Uncharacterized protein n=1 Tax=Sinosporangium siamense TaxID=1367973 RepID=A0A919RIB3_9ACTN|nr:hypothetical protein Ssi02_25950 [Sinosporangium siamense]